MNPQLKITCDGPLTFIRAISLTWMHFWMGFAAQCTVLEHLLCHGPGYAVTVRTEGPLLIRSPICTSASKRGSGALNGKYVPYSSLGQTLGGSEH